MDPLGSLTSPDENPGGGTGAGDSNRPPNPAPHQNMTPTGGGEGERKFTQNDIDRIVGERAKRAGESAVSELLKGLGLERVDDLKAIMTERKKLRDSQLSELDKATKKITELEPTLYDYEAELAEMRLWKALAKSIRQQKIGFASDAAEEDALEHLSRTIEMDGKGSPKNLDDALKTLMKERPYLFGKNGDKPPDINANNRGSNETIVTAEQEAELKNKYGIKR